jgi:hypothetical protein
MPSGNRMSRDAKWKREEGRNQGGHAFAKCAIRPLSPNPSNYCPFISNDNADESATNVDSGDDRERDNEVGTSVVALQHLYAVFLPLTCS